MTNLTLRSFPQLSWLSHIYNLSMTNCYFEIKFYLNRNESIRLKKKRTKISLRLQLAAYFQIKKTISIFGQYVEKIYM